jgi:hypothetical protein
MAIFDEIVKGIDASDRAVLDKYPQLKQSVDGIEAQARDFDQRLKSWEQWRASNWDENANATRREVELQAELAAARAGGGGGVDDWDKSTSFADMAKDLEKQGFVRADTVNKTITENLDRLALGFEEVYKRTVGLPFKHAKEFGPDAELDMGAVLDHMRKNNIHDPQKAYEDFVAPKRAEAQKAREAEVAAKHAAEIAEAERRGEMKAAMGSGGRLPTDQSGSGPIMGHLQRTMLEKAKGANSDDPGPGKLGDNVIAHQGYEDLLKSRAGAA